MLQTFTFDGVGRLVNMQADYFRYESGGAAGADESIRMRMDGQDLGTYLPGDAITLPRRGVLFEITPVNPACTGVIRLGLGRLDSARLVGTVRVVDEGFSKTLAGAQFWGSVARQNGTKFAIVGLLAGTRKVAIKRLQLTSAAAGRVAVFTSTAGPSDGPVISGVKNKSLGGADALTTRISGLSVAITPTVLELPGATSIYSIYVAANGMAEVPLTTPLILAAGQGLFAVSVAINTEVSMNYDIEEV